MENFDQLFFEKKQRAAKTSHRHFFLTTRTHHAFSLLFFPLLLLPLLLLLGCCCWWCSFLKPDREREKVCVQQPARAFSFVKKRKMKELRLFVTADDF